MTTTIQWIEPLPMPDDEDTREMWVLPPLVVTLFHPVSHKRMKVERRSDKYRVAKSQGWVELEHRE